MNGALERYLKQATCLVPPAAAQAIRAELRANLYQDMLDAQLRGLNEQQAWDTVLREAGPAWQVALNFARLYTLGVLARWLLVGMVLGGAAYAVQSSTHAGLAVSIEQRP